MILETPDLLLELDVLLTHVVNAADGWPPTKQNMEAVKQTGFDGCCTICR